MADCFWALRVYLWNFVVNLPPYHTPPRSYAKTSVQASGLRQKSYAAQIAAQTTLLGGSRNFDFLIAKFHSEIFRGKHFVPRIVPHSAANVPRIFSLCGTGSTNVLLGVLHFVPQCSYFLLKTRVTSFNKEKGILKRVLRHMRHRTTHSLSIVGKSFEKYAHRDTTRHKSSVQALEIGGRSC